MHAFAFCSFAKDLWHWAASIFQVSLNSSFLLELCQSFLAVGGCLIEEAHCFNSAVGSLDPLEAT